LEVILKNLEKINEIDNLDVYILSLARSFIEVNENYLNYVKNE